MKVLIICFTSTYGHFTRGGGKTDTKQCAGDSAVVRADNFAVANRRIRLPIADTATLVLESFGKLDD